MSLVHLPSHRYLVSEKTEMSQKEYQLGILKEVQAMVVVTEQYDRIPLG